MRATIAVLLTLHLAGAAEPQPFLRGMGWSPWHAVHGWGRPPEIVRQDFAILKDLHVNALRTWGPITRPGADSYWAEGLHLVPQIGGPQGPRTRFADGKEAGIAFVAPAAQASLADRATALATALKDHPAVAAYLLGNEFSWVGQNAGGHYQHHGFDGLTLAAFRAELRARFGTSERWRELTGRQDASLEAVTPPTGSGKDLLYWEWWRFQRQAFGRFLKAGHNALAAADPATPSTYALLCGSRWDAATEDADLPFLGIQGDNLYFHWGKTWLAYAVRLARRIGPARPMLVTETGINTWHVKDPVEADRLMRQMLWVLVLHDEVKGIFPFVYCDEWWHGPDPKKLDDSGDAWGIVTADRQPKSTYAAVRETYATFERLAPLLDSRRAPVELLVSDQAIDRWRGAAGPSVDEVCAELYRRGVSFRLVSLLHPPDLAATGCRKLLLLDSTIPDEPDGASPARDALRAFAAAGGQILCPNDTPFRGLYGPSGAAGLPATVVPAADWQAAVTRLLGARPITIDSPSPDLFARVLESDDGRWLLLVNGGAKPLERVMVQGPATLELVSGAGVQLRREGAGWVASNVGVEALLRVR